MEKWKLGVIIVLLGGLVGYGIFQSQPRRMVAIDPPPITPQPVPTPILVGQPAPAWNIGKGNWVNTPQPITLDDVKGEVTLIEFWRVGCSNCEEAAPFMESLYKEYSPQGLKMVTFHSPSPSSGPDSVEGNWERVQEMIKEWGITYPVANDAGSVVFNEFQASRYPTVMLLNREGVVEYFETGHTLEKEQALAARVEAMLKGSDAESPAGPQTTPPVESPDAPASP